MAESPLDMVERLHAKMMRRKDRAKKWSDYYDGNRPLLFTSPEFTTQTGGLFDNFSDNWCQVVPDATVERLMPMAFRLDDGTLDDVAWKAWRRNECDVEIGLGFLEALISGRSYALVWNPDGAGVEITFQNIGQAIVEYVPGKRRKRAAGLQAWSDGSSDFATLFLPKEVHWFSRPTKGGAWVHVRSVGNPLGEVPLVEFANRSRLHGKPLSEISNVAPLQDAVNTLWAHLMTASDALALPARAVLGMDRPVREITDDAGEVVGEEDLPLDRFRSDRLLWLEKEGAQIAEFSAADLSNYTRTIEVAVQHIAAQTRTPPHFLSGQLVNVSADALVASEAGLVAKVMERQRFFGSSLREVMRLEALASGDAPRAEQLRLGTVVWRDPQFRSDAQYADALTKFKAVGVPDEALWERIPGVTPDEITRWKDMRTAQTVDLVGIADALNPGAPVEDSGDVNAA